MLGSMVQKGKFSAGIWDFVRALNRVDFPTFGSPMIPHLKPIFIWYGGFFGHLDIFFQ